ncbi:MAG: D-glycero-beta-D-manno-heptose-7-phosphate kinase [Acidobacteria bacterium]|nr:MAG: D-glycero-beta-D-manno-heptose-7-phosphate kinase [Acidobacteriota bacterium]
MTVPLPLPRVQELLRRMAGSRILVVGDIMVDRFLWGSVHRVSPEAPVPVVHLNSESAVLGGAGNVARNLRSLGAEVDLVGVVGRDRGAEEFWRLLTEAGLSGQRVIEISTRSTTTKTRVIAHHQQVVRIDRESQDPLERVNVEQVSARALEMLPKARAIVISDYDKGVISPEILRRILPGARDAGIPVAVDPKPTNYRFYRPATVITPNLPEARIMTGTRGRTEEEVLLMGQALQGQLGCEALLLTRGEQGMTLFKSSREPVLIPASAREVFDVTGAGDTVVAVLALSLAAGATIEEAANLANLAAGLVVGKLGTAVVTPEELEETAV